MERVCRRKHLLLNYAKFSNICHNKERHAIRFYIFFWSSLFWHHWPLIWQCDETTHFCSIQLYSIQFTWVMTVTSFAREKLITVECEIINLCVELQIKLSSEKKEIRCALCTVFGNKKDHAINDFIFEIYTFSCNVEWLSPWKRHNKPMFNV